jgi:ankyrin repeat protein/tetratricopeptide (TPR) repeat protein
VDRHSPSYLRRSIIAVLAMQALSTNTFAAEYACLSPRAILPHETWDLSAPADNDALFDMARDAIDHWSSTAELNVWTASVLQTLIARERRSARGYVQYARLMMKAQSVQRLTMNPFAYDLAYESLRRAFEFDPESPDAWLTLAEFEMRRKPDEKSFGRSDAQEHALLQAYKFAANGPALNLAWARLSERRFDHATAARYAKRVLASKDRATDVQLADAEAFLAHVARHDDEIESAERHLEQAIRLEPDNPYHWIDYSALLLEENGDTKRAVVAAREGICIYPTWRGEQALAFALYNDWALDNVAVVEPDTHDPRVAEAYVLYDDLKNVMGYSAEHAALAPLVDVFIRMGADPDSRDPQDGETALEDAVRQGDLETARRLIELGADVNTIGNDFSVLGGAVLNGDRAMAHLLLEAGADINLQWPQGTALLVAVRIENLAMVRYLLAAGADPNLGDDNGETPLSALVHAEGRLDFARALLEAGADPNQRLPNDLTLAEYAARFGDPKLAALLVEAEGERP